MAKNRLLIRGGHIVSMDANGDLPAGDVLIEDGKIVAVGAALAVEDAEVVDAGGHIVAPGLIDTHRHTWQTQMRAICADWSLADYFFGMRLSISPAYRAEDVYLGNLLGALDALDSGVTTILDFSHCNNTPEHSDAAVAGLRDAGVRAVFGYGFFESSPFAPPHFKNHEDRIPDFERVADAYFASKEALLTLGVALTEPGTIPLSSSAKEVRAARARGCVIVTHTGCVWSAPTGVSDLDAAGLIGPEQVHVHCNTLKPHEWEILARAGAKISISPETELNMGMGRPVFAECERYGLKPTLSCDVISLNSGDLFTQMRLGLGFKRWADTEQMNLAGNDPVKVSTTCREALAWSTINAAEAVDLADRIGSITPGKRADLILVGGPGMSQHPHIDATGTLVFQTTSSDVRSVLVDGRFVKREGKLIGVDLATQLRRGDESASAILDRARRGVPSFPPTPPNGFEGIADLAAKHLRS